MPFVGAQFIKSEWSGYEAQQRYEDVLVIAEALRAWRPSTAVEFGTAKGGFAVFLAETLKEWGGLVYSVDVAYDAELATQLYERYDNLALYAGNLLAPDADMLRVFRLWTESLLSGERPFLYCDNGHKMAELQLWVPKLPRLALVGVHDYGTEVDPAEAEAFMAAQGFTPFWHDRFAALAHPEWYPVSLTRLWERAA